MANGPWRKSSRSGGGSGSNCVEARLSDEGPQLSDSKLADDRPILEIGRSEYVGLLSAIKNDQHC